ncbi:MAG: DUF1700 domain-containing protein [Lachnospiraceae bacterium]|nr:DUF1700 domain-containing protein [Lachnospiraceae bacterium]
MTKQEFLEELKNALSGEVSPEAMMDSYRYYSDYIDEGIRHGRPEEEILEELGKPALLARSIIAAQSGERKADLEYTEDGRTRKVKKSQFFEKEERDKKTEKAQREKKFVFDFNSWYAKVLGILIFLLVVFFVYLVIKVSSWILLTFGIPILLVLGIIYLVMYFTR